MSLRRLDDESFLLGEEPRTPPRLLLGIFVDVYYLTPWVGRSPAWRKWYKSVITSTRRISSPAHGGSAESPFDIKDTVYTGLSPLRVTLIKSVTLKASADPEPELGSSLTLTFGALQGFGLV